MRIVHIVSSLELGGAERLLVDLAREQVRRGHTVQILTLSGGGALTPGAREAGVSVKEHELRHGHPLVRLRNLLRLGRAVRTAGHDVMHTWMYHAGLLGVVLAPQKRRVLLSLHHDDPRDDGMGSATRLIARALAYLARWSGAVVYVSESARSHHEAAGYPAAHGIVIPGGVDAQRFQPLSTERRRQLRASIDPGARHHDTVVVHLSRYHADKDPRLMIAAFAAARAEHGSLRLWMIGRGMERTNRELSHLITQHGVSEAVALLGPSDSPQNILAAGDIIAVSSRTESFGLVLIEGMLCGLAGVSTRVGVAESLLPEDHLAEAGDADGLARALLFAIAADRNTAGHRDAGMTFGLERMTDEFDELYIELQGRRLTAR